jgi:aryl-alcohol dehydrogenase-like predicted oxidoreductase
VPKAQVALAWVAQKAIVTAPIVGVSKSHHLDDAVASLTLNSTARPRSHNWKHPTFRTPSSVTLEFVPYALD